jgi:YD repeat-containing protein
MDSTNYTQRFFVSYSGVKLPLKLVNQLQDSELGNRNTYFLGFFDAAERLVRLEKRVYSEIELLHCYRYHDNGALQEAEITDADGEVTVLNYDADGQLVDAD